MSPRLLSSVEPLEPRRLLAGVTLVTHGLQTGGRPAWLDKMTDAMQARLGGASVYRLVLGPTGTSGVAQVNSFARITTGLTTNAESIIELDWSSVSNFLSNPVYTGQVATLVLPYLINAQSLPGDPNTQQPFAQLPIHLVGHSRGGSLVSELARQLGAQGVWVDHLTALDAFPVGSDPAVSIGDNVNFAENEYETGDFIVHGSSITGTHNVNLSSLSGMSHSNTHTWYHGTIDRAATSADGQTINSSWYTGASTGPRYAVGEDWSDFAGTARPADGVGTNFGGSASRSPVGISAGQPWSNVGDLKIASGAPGGSIADGAAISLAYRYSDTNGGGDTVSFLLDNDTNPYNGTVASLGSEAVPASSAGAAPVRNFATAWPILLSNGLYYLFAKISDSAGHARYAMLSTPLSKSGASGDVRVITKRWTGNIDTSWSNASNWTPGGMPTAADRTAIVSAMVNVSAGVASASVDVHGGVLHVISGTVSTSVFADGNAEITLDSTQHLQGLTLSDSARLNVTAGGMKLLSLDSLALAGDGTIDLNDNDMLLAYATTNSPLGAVGSWIRTARNGGNWLGSGITSTSARLNPAATTTLGAMEASDLPGPNFDGESPDATTVLVKYTWYGDADFSGTINFDDYVHTDIGFNTGLTGWSNGDFNYSGTVNFDDYVLIDVAFNTQSGTLSRGKPAPSAPRRTTSAHLRRS